MIDLKEIARNLQNCPCGRKHELGLEHFYVESGLTPRTGEILRRIGAPDRLHLVADGNTIRASAGVRESLARAGFVLTETMFDNLTVASAEAAERVERESEGADALLSVGTGSLNDICRINAFRHKKPFYILATAPSMDGFASANAPITINGFKQTLDAVIPTAILADTKVLANAPAELPAAGFGDLIGKYTALCDWNVSRITTGEYHCPRIEALTRGAVDRAVALADGIRKHSEESAAALMDALVLSGLAMKLSGCTRPASGAEHHLAHFWEMQYMLQGKPPVYHGIKVGIACALVAEKYNALAKLPSIELAPRPTVPDPALEPVFGPLWGNILKENVPDPVTDEVRENLRTRWPEIREALKSVPDAEEIRRLLRLAGAPATCEEKGISKELEEQAFTFGYLVRFRMTMMRLSAHIQA